jgi:hypothetical protein
MLFNVLCSDIHIESLNILYIAATPAVYTMLLQALAAKEFGGVGAIFRLSTKIGTKVAKTELLTGDQILSCFGYKAKLLPLDLFMLLLLAVVAWSGVYVLLRRAKRS